MLEGKAETNLNAGLQFALELLCSLCSIVCGRLAQIRFGVAGLVGAGFGVAGCLFLDLGFIMGFALQVLRVCVRGFESNTES